MIDLLKIIYYISFGLILLIVILILLQKYRLNRISKTEPKVRAYLFDQFEGHQESVFPFTRQRLFKSIQKINDQIILSDTIKSHLYQNLLQKKDIIKLHKQAHSIFPLKRLKAAHRLSFISNQRDFFVGLIKKEKNPIHIFYLVYYLLPMMDSDVFDVIMEKIIGMKENIVTRIGLLISNHYDVVKTYLPNYLDVNTLEHMHIQLLVASKEMSYILPDETIDQLRLMVFNEACQKDHLMPLLLKYMKSIHHPFLLSDDIIHSNDSSIRQYGYEAMADKDDWSAVIQLFDHLENDADNLQYIIDLILTLSHQPKILNRLFYYKEQLTSDVKKQALAQIMSENIENIILKFVSLEDEMALSNLKFVIEYDFTAGLIAFINKNRDQEIEDKLFNQIDFHIYQKNNEHLDFFYYIKPEILRRHELKSETVVSAVKKRPPIEWSKIIWLSIALLLALSIYPVISLIEQRFVLNDISVIEILKNMVIDTNRYLIYFFMTSYSVYVILMLVSLYGGHKQNLLWDIKSSSLLYEDELLPPISIIAPAYNEEVNIITSVQSLLNLKYPKYEVIVVNDGSRDRTLDVLVDHFQLKRKSPYILSTLKTKDIRGIYYNHEYPNLYVVNKVNGGKADALNVGINVSHYPYICGIDADSVLDQDALLRLMSSSLDQPYKPVALGGNIVPANGCKIDHGYVEERHFPKEAIARFQAVEYLRSFSSGRIGWSELNSLLIISGAFGLFNKKDIIDIGGYITSSGALKKDSVGEDMELVVRLTYQRMKHQKKSYIGYIYHANCYTELPSDTHTLLKQRNRWHRGLIDILNYHRKMTLNPRYKHIGLVVFPYFYIFEVLGPFFEWIGYGALIISLILGLLSPTIVMMIFGLSVILGIIVSLLSLLIQESQTEYMKRRDMIFLVVFSIIENIGYRQLLSLHRIYSFFSAFFESGKWGEQKRKGIS